MASELTVIAEFHVPGIHLEAFLAVCAEDSRQSIAVESGCHSFEVLSSPEDPNLVVLVETYTDRAAFEAHLKTPHFAAFAKAVKDYGAKENAVRFFNRTAP
ncbi:putative quinol monooxygenase [Neokomagataea anthophila]|uniref:Antibiotic biosynthesis monooxygenase n=1 Tax=Neokomagataea anthophila TaxID=2826925 RepID=A0ABS5E4S6_9PROT|nr:putative quinol monooxygenase [Neokomagataea anthophila]MBR0558904.1 antibiotic biosynthesis monooxygenase [Neokomagataea anthophila]